MSTKNSIWSSLKNTANEIKSKRLIDLFSANPDRAKQFSLRVDDIYLDYSKNFINEDVIAQLIDLANSCSLKSAISRLMTGEPVNVTENRCALHTALRRDANSSLMVNGFDVMPKIVAQRERMSQIVHQLQAQEWFGATGKVITDVVNIGIGGSDLGPKMAVQALKNYQTSKLALHFVSNIDPVEMTSVLSQLNPATTLFIISSKSFTTTETLTNASLAKAWLIQHLKTQQVESHFIAVTTKPEKAKAFGIAALHILTFEEWVGGRYSIWSTIGLPLALSIGMAQFESFLLGARKMDEHFATAPFSQNMPVLLALIGIWYTHGWGAQTMSILPYAHGLRRFADYLQQLDMESNGKSAQINGEIVEGLTGPIVWGQAGTNGQHAFYQLLHQGTHFVPIDFIASIQSETSLDEQHKQFIANCLAQAQALMQGTLHETSLSTHEIMPGNKPSNVLLLTKITPSSLGQLISLYEHKVYVQGIIWGINSFDQPGVELGKKLASKIIDNIQQGKLDENLDGSTRELIHLIRRK